MKNPAYAYRQHSVQGASPVNLVVMLYDGAISALQRAKGAMEARDIEKKVAHLNRALEILCQLEGSLDFERGGKVAETLKTFYTYARNRALQASIQNSPDMLAALVKNLSTLREAWESVDRQGKAPSAPPPAPTPTLNRDVTQQSESPSLRLTA